MHQAACGGTCPLSKANEEEDAAAPMDTVGEVMGCLCEILGDAANSAFGWAVSTDDEDSAAVVGLPGAPAAICRADCRLPRDS